MIDFGVAKATGPRLTEQSVYTEVGSLVGTLEYMSPEQAELNNLDIDTRADIYALGVILYELLTGAVPFTRKELEKAGLAEMLRVHQGGRAAQAEHEAVRLGHAAERGGRPRPGAAEADAASARRAGLDRDEVPGEGAEPAVRDGQRAGAGRAAVSGRRAGAGRRRRARPTGCGSSCGGTRGRCWRRAWSSWRWWAASSARRWGLSPAGRSRRRANEGRERPSRDGQATRHRPGAEAPDANSPGHDDFEGNDRAARVAEGVDQRATRIPPVGPFLLPRVRRRGGDRWGGTPARGGSRFPCWLCASVARANEGRHRGLSRGPARFRGPCRRVPCRAQILPDSCCQP